MPEPLTFQALEYVAAKLETISSSDGYFTNVNTVHLSTGQETYPCLYVAAFDMPTQNVGGVARVNRVNAVIEGHIAAGDDDQKTAHRLLADIRAALPIKIPRDEQINGITGVEITGQIILPAERQITTIQVAMTISITETV